MSDDGGVDSNGIPYGIRGLRSLSDADLEQAILRSTHSLVAGDIRRGRASRADRQATLVIRLTWAIMFMTATVVAMTFVFIVRGSLIRTSDHSRPTGPWSSYPRPCAR